MSIEALKDELMVQQQLPATDRREWAWQHMVAVIMLNQTGRKAVKYVLPLFLDRWPGPGEFLWTMEDEVKEVIWPLGMYNTRFKRLKRMTADFLTWDGNDATMLYGIGKYGSDSYYLFLKERERFPFNVFLHKFLKGDPDDVHDHPWPYATLILKGGYYEWVPQFDSEGKKSCEIRKWRGPGHFRICKPTSYHRIELKDGVTAWTLFMPGPHKRDWGFLVNNKWIQHEQYLKERHEQAHNKPA